jgi:hypothetical protein
MGMGTETSRLEAVEALIVEVWPGDLGARLWAAVRHDEAIGALAWRVVEARLDGRDPAEPLNELDVDDVEWVITDADYPAAYLASQLSH